MRGSLRTSVSTSQVTSAGTAGSMSKVFASGSTLLMVYWLPLISTVSPSARRATSTTVIVVSVGLAVAAMVVVESGDTLLKVNSRPLIKT